MTDERILSAKPRGDETSIETTLRPRYLAEYIGQDKVKENLRIALAAAQKRGEPLDHVLLHGPPGLGKTTLACILANEMDAQVRITTGPAIERQGDLAAMLTNLEPGDVLFIDEIHRLSTAIEEVLYSAMEDFALDLVIGKGPGSRTVRLSLPRFTLVGATTRYAMLSAPLRDRFGLVHRLDYYDLAAISAIIRRSAAVLGVEISEAGVAAIATRSRGTPRVANRLLRRVRDYAQVMADGVITEAEAGEALARLDIDALGLDEVDHKIIRTLVTRGGPIGLETLAASISEEADTIMDVYEPYLLEIGFLDRTPKGRQATRRAYEHLGVAFTASPNQRPLWDGASG